MSKINYDTVITMVSTKNVLYKCGKRFLRKDRIILLVRESDMIYQNLEAYSRRDYDFLPIWESQICDYFRPATKEEIQMFENGILITERVC